MKKISYLVGLLLIVNFAFGAYSVGATNSPTTDEGVVVAGIRWATRNVDAPGTFAANPESTGMFFQWGKRYGWATTGEVVGWENSVPFGTRWMPIDDPCPEGWRIPTVYELRSLRYEKSEWTSLNGVNGRLFGSAPNQLFLPATGWRLQRDGALVNVGKNGYYWSVSKTGSGFARYLGFMQRAKNLSATNQAYGFSVRCVFIE